MGVLESALGSVLGGRSGGARGRSPVVNAILMALAAKALQHVLSQRRGGGAQAKAAGGDGLDLGSILGGVLGGRAGGGLGGLGGLIAGMGGAGALGGLIDHFGGRGQGGQVQSWVGPGANEPLTADELAGALDDDDIDQLSREMDLPKDEVVRQVAAVLPVAIDELTPEGRLPSEIELQRMVDEAEAEAASASSTPQA